MGSEEGVHGLLLQFVRSFTPQKHPDLLMLTGGEPLLYPSLIQELVGEARSSGCRACLISGMFFAQKHAIAPVIMNAIRLVDHFTASVDEFHQTQVPLKQVVWAVGQIRAAGVDVSFQATVRSSADPFLDRLLDALRMGGLEDVPVLACTIGQVGRATSLGLTAAENGAPRDLAGPCIVAGWPTVAWDGTVVACCNQEVVNGAVPPHLRLGHISREDWPTIERRCIARPMLRALRFYGPVGIAQSLATDPKTGCNGFCGTCRRLSDHPEVISGVTERFSGRELNVLELESRRLQKACATDAYGCATLGALTRRGAFEIATP